MNINADMRQRFAQALLPRGTPTFLPINASTTATYANPYAGQPNQQGGNFGAGGGGPNRYDYTQAGSGLWSIGIDRSSPNAVNQALSWYQSQDPGTRADIGRLGGRNVNDPVGLLDTIDARQRDVARKITKTNGFMDSAFGKILGVGLPLAAGFFGPIAGAAAGAAMGGAKGGIKGALLGGASSAIAPAIKMPGLSSIARAPVQAGLGVAKQFANPVNALRQVGSLGLGAVKTRRV